MNAMANATTAAAAISEAQALTHSGHEGWRPLLAVQIVMMVSAAAAVALRFVSRRIGPRELWWDDWVILAALIPSLAGNITNIVAIDLGLGRHLWDSPHNGLGYVKTIIPVGMLFTLAVALAKGSVLLLYKRIFSLDSHTSRWVNIVAAIIITWCITIELVILLQCRPISAFWDPSINGQCLDFRKLNLASAIGHIITTVMVIAFPQPLIWKLNMCRSKKIAYSSICGLGITTAIASIGRIIAVNTLPAHAVLSKDFTWYPVPAAIWYSTEPAIGIVCACLPCIGPIFRKNPFAKSGRSSSDAENALNQHRTSEAGNTSMLRRLGATCEVSIYTAARENMSENFKGETTQARRRGGSEGVVYIRNSTRIE